MLLDSAGRTADHKRPKADLPRRLSSDRRAQIAAFITWQPKARTGTKRPFLLHAVNMAPIPRVRTNQGIAIFGYGFRPFFLVGAVFAGLGILIWLPLFFGDLGLPTTLPPVDWHAHEMLYGYLPAVMTGFLLTAIPNWTGRLPLQGGPLVFLVAVWLVGRLAIMFSALIGPILAAGLDILFLVLVAAAVAREIVAGRNWRNLGPVVILFVFTSGNVIFHVEAYRGESGELGRRIGIAAAIAIIVVIGGRVIPSFTRNWLTRANPGRLPAPFGRFDIISIAISGLALIMWIATPDLIVTGVSMLIAGIVHAIRLARWAGNRTFRDRMVLILHVGYAFVPLGFLLLGGAILLPQDVPVSAGIHAWTAGAIGIMTLAMMTRVSLGHTGRATIAGPMTHVIYAAVLIGCVVRICAAFEPSRASLMLQIGGGAWAMAFFVFAMSFGPLLVKPGTNSH
jgi:uncharacterized protein involved in response to NO